jgi:hypothetical protein
MEIAREGRACSVALSSDDVLISILEQLPDDETDSAAALAPVMTVSKRWSVECFYVSKWTYANSMLYRH